MINCCLKLHVAAKYSLAQPWKGQWTTPVADSYARDTPLCQQLRRFNLVVDFNEGNSSALPLPVNALLLPLSGIIFTSPIPSTTPPFTCSLGGILQIYCSHLLYIFPHKEIFLMYLRGVLRAVTLRRRRIAEISYARSSTSIFQSRKPPLLALPLNCRRRPWRRSHCGS